MQTDSSGGATVASPASAGDGPVRTRRLVDVSELRASQVQDYARRRAASGDDVYVERRGGRTFVVTAGP